MLLHTLWKHYLSEKKRLTINYKVVPKYLKCDEVVDNQIKKGLLLRLSVKNSLKSVNIWQSYKQKVVVSCTLCTWPPHC